MIILSASVVNGPSITSILLSLDSSSGISMYFSETVLFESKEEPNDSNVSSVVS